jgi:RNAse (barnase) inhibitor barstar
MREIVMDGKGWIAPGDIYESFFQAVGAPGWHGRNFNALRDSIAVGHINKIEVPYLIKIKNYAAIGAEARSMASDFVEFIKQLRESGCPVDIQAES